MNTVKRLALLVSIVLSQLAAQVVNPPFSGSGGGGGSGTVTSIVVAGTVNQITASGTCNITTTGTCTLSIPSAFVIPGTINALTLTAPATGATLTLANNSSLITVGAFATTLTSSATTNSTLPAGTHSLAPLDSPSFTTPTLGVAAATTVNKYTFTAPATGATLTIADGKTFTSSNTWIATATDGSTVAFGAGGTVLYSGSLTGYMAKVGDNALLAGATGNSCAVTATQACWTLTPAGIPSTPAAGSIFVGSTGLFHSMDASNIRTYGYFLGSGVTPATVATGIVHSGSSFALTSSAVVLTSEVSGILPVANGGTNNAFFTVSGPASSAKTYTFPNANSTMSITVASGAKALATSAISSAACSSAQTDTATGTLTTDAISATFSADPTAITGYVPLTAGGLTIYAYPTADTVNFKVCNFTSSSITPGAVTLNWRVVR